MKWFDHHLIDEWRSSFKLLSIQFQAFIGIAAIAWQAVPEDQRNALAEAVGIRPSLVMAVSAAVSIYMRLVAQRVPDKEDGDEPQP